jgi:hypothetical protein
MLIELLFVLLNYWSFVLFSFIFFIIIYFNSIYFNVFFFFFWDCYYWFHTCKCSEFHMLITAD